MDAGIGPTRAGDGHLATVQLAKRTFEETLDRRPGRLSLPPDELSSVVRQGDLERCHRFDTKDTKDIRSQHEIDLGVLRVLCVDSAPQAITGLEPGFTTGSPFAQSGH